MGWQPALLVATSFADFSPSLIGAAAFITAVGGVASTIMALRKSRTEDHEQCIENLKQSRAEAERLAEELHQLKMERAGEAEIEAKGES